MTITTLGLQNFTLLLAGFINLIMSILVFFRGVKHNKINLYFSLLAFFNFLWAIGLLLSRSFIDLELKAIFARSTFISAIAIVISLLYFIIYFPHKIKKLSIGLKIVIWVPAFFLVSIIYSELFIINFVTKYSNYEYIAYFYKPSYWAYFIYFIFISFLAIKFLYQKYRLTEGLFRKQVKFLFFAIIIGLIFGVYFDLWLLYFGNYRFNWLGPIFTAFMNGYVFYLIFYNKEK